MNWNKKNIQKIVLIGVALIIWFLVLVKYFGFSTNEIKDENVIPINFQNNKIVKKNYILNLDYEDPFLKGQKMTVKSSVPTISNSIQIKTNRKNQSKKEVINSDEISFTWPEITYKGMASNKSRLESFAWIDFKGEMIILKLNKVVKDYKVEAIYTDSLIISRDGKYKTYLKKS